MTTERHIACSVTPDLYALSRGAVVGVSYLYDDVTRVITVFPGESETLTVHDLVTGDIPARVSFVPDKDNMIKTRIVIMWEKNTHTIHHLWGDKLSHKFNFGGPKLSLESYIVGDDGIY
jgi:hypothetical protein